jgi:hypothetical protein
VINRTTTRRDRALLAAALAAATVTFVSSRPARADDATFAVGALTDGPVRFTLGSYRPRGDAYVPLAGTEFHITVRNGKTDAPVVTTDVAGQALFEVIATTRRRAPAVEITELARTDYPFQGASCGHDFQPLLDWTDRPTLTVEVDPGWNVGCTFYHLQARRSPNPATDPTPPPTDALPVVVADDSSVLPLAEALLLAIISVVPLGRRRRRSCGPPTIDS